MPEPLFGGVEPVGGNPIGASGMPVGAEPVTEPTTPVQEPASDDEYEDVDFEDLKTVPPQFQKVAKKLQGSFTKKMQAIASLETMKQNQPQPEVTPEPNPTMDQAKRNVMNYMTSPEGSALKEVFESMVNEKLGTLPQEVMKQKVNMEVSAVMQKYGEDNVNSNYDAIEAATRANPGVPLDYIVSNILYAKAKEIGANEYKSKIIRKSEFSDSPRSSSSNVVTNKAANSFEEAFESAQSSLGV